MRLHYLLSVLPVVLAYPSIRRDEPAPLLVSRNANAAVPNKYIVKLKDASTDSILDDALSILPKDPDHVFSTAFKGFSATLDKAALAAIRNQPNVEYVEEDAVISIDSYTKQSGAQWGLGRISHRKPGSTQYVYDSSAGAGTCAYVLDTGVEDTHVQFQGRAQQIKTFVGTDNTDGNGHGTHVAGTIGGVTYGVAKKTKIFGVKVLADDGNGSYASIVAGMDFIIKDSATTARKAACPKGFVVNISIGGPYSSAVNAAAAAMVKKNIFVAVAAGNDAQDATNHSPASEPLVCTVGAISKGDSLAPYSNFGSLVDVFAPGTAVKSAWIGNSVNTLSGTSMATPHVTGLAAYFAGLTGFPGAQTLCNRVKTTSTTKVVTGLPAGTANRLAFNYQSYN